MDQIDKMREFRKEAPEYLLRYTNMRTHRPYSCIAVFEGNEDYLFYRRFLTQELQNKIEVLCVNGKDSVLKLRENLSLKVEEKAASKVLYFIDKDFDHCKDYCISENIYITPCYSFENFLISEDILKLLLRGEFYLNDGNMNDESKVLSLFNNRLEEFFKITKEINQRLYYARVNKIRAIIDMGRFEDNLKVSETRTFFKKDDLQEIIKIANEIDQDALTKSNMEFEKLDRLLDWRGKFIFDFFKKFIALLKNDRGSENPKIFTNKKAGVKINPDNSLITILVSIIVTPPCFTDFLKNAENIINLHIE